MKRHLAPLALLAAVGALPVAAADVVTDQGFSMPVGATGSGSLVRVASNAGAEADGVIHSVDAKEGVVNLTHGPIPSLSWPSMTMDLPVADGVDLSGVQPGDKVRFRVVLGADQVYRITAIDPAP